MPPHLHPLSRTPAARAARWAVLVLAIAAAALPARAHAQTVLGVADDATTAPFGMARVRASNDWSRFDQTRRGTDTSNARSIGRIRITRLEAELGVLPRVSLRATVPFVSTHVVTTPHVLANGRFVADTVLYSDHNTLGDVEVAAKIAWLDPLSGRKRFAPTGVHVRSAIEGVWRLPTGVPDTPEDPFDVGTGDRPAIEGASLTDVVAGRHFFLTLAGRVGHPLTRPVSVRVPSADDSLATVVPPILAQRRPGFYYQIDVTPRWEFARYLVAGVRYRYRHQNATIYTGSETVDVNGTPTIIDAAPLNAGTATTEHRVTLGLTYSTVAGFARRATSFPFDVGYRHEWWAAVSGMPSRQRDVIELRWWFRAWGKGLRPPAR